MKTILIIDDEEKIRQTYGKLLIGKGYNVITAKSGLSALDIIKTTHHIDLVLLDINLGEVNGEDLFEIISSFHPQIKIIVTSVYPLEDQQKLIKNAVDYYDKAESVRKLFEKIDTSLGNSGDHDAPKTVLVIDDEKQTRNLFQRILSGAGFHCIAFGDSLDIMRYLHKKIQKIHLVLLDLSMPQLDGPYIFNMLRDRFPATPIMIVSNYTVNEQKFQTPAAQDYYDKSEGNAALVRKVKYLISQV